jgi:hypothetical protein
MSRPILPWRSPLVLAPADGALIWIRRLPWYDRPVRAQSVDADAAQLEVSTSNLGGETHIFQLPFATVHSWKFQYLEDETCYQNARRPGDPR